MSLFDDEEVISLLHTKVYLFSDSVLCFAKVNEKPRSNIAWEDRLTWFKSSSQYRALDRIDGEPMEFQWNIFPGFTTLQLCNKVQELLSRLSVEPENFTGRIILMSMCNDISWGSEDNEKECESSAQLVAREMGFPRHASNRRRRTREGPEPACVQTPLRSGVAHAGKEGRINVLPWYRPVGVAKNLQ